MAIFTYSAGVIGREFSLAFRHTMPVLLGYLAIGLAFGLLLSAAHFPWWLAAVMSLCIYAGAAQYMAIGLLSAQTGLAETALLTLLINARHMVYGVSLLERFRNMGWVKAYLIFALTDETYALLTSLPDQAGVNRKRLYTYISALDQSYWIIGSVAGALVGNFLPIPTKGMEFALVALFVVLLIEQVRSRWPGNAGTDPAEQSKPWQSLSPFIIAGLSCLISALAFGPKNLLMPAIIITIIGLAVSELLRPKADQAL